MQVLRRNSGKDSMFTNPILEHMHAKTTKILLIRGSLFHKVFFRHFFENGHNGNFRVGIKIIDGADDVFRFEGGSCFGNIDLKLCAIGSQ